MMAGVADDDNVAFAVLLYSYIIAREEEDEQQTDQRQSQPQRARRAAVRQFWVRSWLREGRRNLWVRELVADCERSCKKPNYSYLIAFFRIFSYQLVSDRESFVSGLEQWYPTERNKAWHIVGDRNTSQQNVVFVLSKIDPDHHDLEARLDAMCHALLRYNTIWYDDPDLTIDRVDRRKIWNRSKSFYD